MKLYIANKTYSSWSVRPWVVLKHFGIPFEEVWLRYDTMKLEDNFKSQLARAAPDGTGKVPLLVDGDVAIWDSLAICEYLAERFPEKRLWPTDPKMRAYARSVSAEMHSGFTEMRGNLVFNLDCLLPDIGSKLMREKPGVRSDVERVLAIFHNALVRSDGPFLFGEFTIADAFFVPVVVGRLRTYCIPIDDPIVSRYLEAVEALPEVQEWVRLSKLENQFVPNLEPHRTSRN